MEEFNHFAEMATKVHEATGQIVRKTAFNIQAKAVVLIRKDTGNASNGIYVKTSEEDNYPGSATGHLIQQDVPEADDLTAFIACAADYSLYLEMGTVHMAAYPFMAPATEGEKDSFESALEKLEDFLRTI